MLKKLVPLLAMLISFQAFGTEKYIVIMNNASSFNSVRRGIEGKAAYPFLSEKAKVRRTFPTVNGLSVEMSDSEAGKMERQLGVKSVSKNRTYSVPQTTLSVAESEGAYTYGLSLLNIPALREASPKADGRGVVVGVLDTGVDGSHPDLKGKVIAFKDFTDEAEKTPHDGHGHGTHVSGTIAGGNASGTAIGVAPGVSLVEGKIFDSSGSTTDEVIMAAMEWMMSYDGKGAKPSVVSNSWGGGKTTSDPAKDPLYSYTAAWVKAGIVPVFAAGNEGPSASTVGVPGGFPNAYAVGAVDDKSNAASFSSRGPVKWTIKGKPVNLIKPEIAAPGVRTQSAMPGGKYQAMSGTSMATPHVAGVVALVVQANPNLSVADIQKIIGDSSKPLGTGNTYGKGLVDAHKAVEMASSFKWKRRKPQPRR